MSVVQEIIEAQKQRRAEAERKFSALVKEIIDGGKPLAATVEKALEAAGKGVRDLERAIAVEARRKQLRQIIEAAAGADDEVGKVAKLINQENERFAGLELEHRRKSMELVARREAAVGRISARESAKRELQELHDDDDRQAIAEAGRDIDAAEAAKRSAEKALRHIESQAAAPAEVVQATQARLAAAEVAAAAALDRQNELLQRASER